MRLAIISDTHLPRGSRELPPACVAQLRAADLIVHAGDLSAAVVLDELRALGPPVVAVHGNADDEQLRIALPAARLVEAGGARIAVVHDGGRAAGRLARLRERFGDADAVIFGHSHVPLHERSADGAFQIFNPGSPTDRRRQPQHTMGVAEAADGSLRFELVPLPVGGERSAIIGR